MAHKVSGVSGMFIVSRMEYNWLYRVLTSFTTMHPCFYSEKGHKQLRIRY
jgi:hypothetical protein